jgi:hypothetical protein
VLALLASRLQPLQYSGLHGIDVCGSSLLDTVRLEGFKARFVNNVRGIQQVGPLVSSAFVSPFEKVPKSK